MGYVNIGFGNIINSDKIISVVSYDSSPIKRLLRTSQESGKVIDATQGRKTRSLIITDTGFVVVSALQPETIMSRLKGDNTEVIRGEEDEQG